MAWIPAGWQAASGTLRCCATPPDRAWRVEAGVTQSGPVGSHWPLRGSQCNECTNCAGGESGLSGSADRAGGDEVDHSFIRCDSWNRWTRRVWSEIKGMTSCCSGYCVICLKNHPADLYHYRQLLTRWARRHLLPPCLSPIY